MTEPKNLPTTFSVTDMEKMATVILKSKLFGMETVDQTLTLMLLAQSEGMHPATAARDFHIIKGRPAMKADAMLARFQQSGGKVEWQEYTDAKVAAYFSHPQSPKPVLIEWTFAHAAKIGLTGKDTWKNYPRAMLRARVISEGVRTCFPVISTGIYTPEEIQDFPTTERDVTPESVTLPSAPITPTTGAMDALNAARQEIVIETAQQIKAAFAEDRAADAYGLYSASGFDNDEKVALWSLMDSKIRSTLKRMHAAEEAHTKGAISEPQKKRLEAIIKERKLDRENVKAFCKAQYSKEHFSDLTPAEYTDLEAALEQMATASEAA